MTAPPRVRLVENDERGFWRIIARPSHREAVDVTFVRGAPTLVQSMTTTDPFGPAEATLQFSGITMLDSFGPGSGDLDWLVPEMNIDIVWSDDEEIPDPGQSSRDDLCGYRWEGYVTNFGWSFAEASGALTLQCAGAMRQLDYYLAMPEYLSRPITYERAIERQFIGKPGLRVGRMRTNWPKWWSKNYKYRANQNWWMRPAEISDGEKWTGMLTRETGQREPVLTSYIQSLLAAMQTGRGQWTLDLYPGRIPVLKHRDMRLIPRDSTLVIDVTTPGVSMTLDQDFTQRANVMYGQGRSLQGVTFSGMQVTPSGGQTYYEPFAWNRDVHPEGRRKNTAFLRDVMRHEIDLPFHEGVTPAQGEAIAKSHLKRFSEPGITGSLELSMADPRQAGDNSLFPRQLIRAGMQIRLDNLFGMNPGPMFHITEARVSPASNQASITVDTKFRDQLTVQEIRLRGRDAMKINRMLTPGGYQPNMPDQLLPWNYNKGSGYMPLESKELFKNAPADLQFPWEEWTTRRPPSKRQWRDCYIKIGAVDKRNATQNWNRPNTRRRNPVSAIRLAQAGDIKLLQVAAFWEDGTVAPVSFHLSLYSVYDVSGWDTPILQNDINTGKNRRYKEGQHYPFFPNAWEQYDSRGRISRDVENTTSSGSGLVIGYGGPYERAGYWPGTSSDNSAEPTGLLVDESGFSFDGTQSPDWEPYKKNTFRESGRFGVLIYCDDQGSDDVYFLGRLYRREIGAG